MGVGGVIDRMWRAVFPRRSALRRRSDRMETLAVRSALAVLVLAIPFAVLTGQLAAHAQAASAARTLATAHPVDATVVAPPMALGADASTAITGVPPVVEVAWGGTGPDRHTATVTAPPTVALGDTIQVWIDRDGTRVPPPPDPSTAATSGTITAIGVLIGLAVVLALAVIGVRLALDRARMRRWDADWWAFVHRRHRGATG